MSDTLTVRDHRYGCEHEPPWVHAHQLANGKWCPGGREIVLLSDEMIERAAEALHELPETAISLERAEIALRAALEVSDE